MKRPFSLLLLLCSVITASAQSKSSGRNTYFPPRGDWEHRAPALLGLKADKLQAAIRFAQDHEARYPRDLELTQAIQFGKEPFSAGIGPFSERGEPTGVIVYHGYIVAEWGTPLRVDITNSVTKSFLSSVVGLAVDRGLIRSVYDTVAPYIPPIEVYDPISPKGHPLLYPFASAHNRTITWDDMLRQTSDWEGTLWDKPDWADRPEGTDPEVWQHRKRNTPGTVYKYNDVRVNALALAATCVWRQPLPQVLKTNIMDPIGASNTWRWYGYRNAWIVLDGAPVQSVSGGGHWGGGMFIHAYDMARFGLLTLHRGQWDGKQLLSDQWVKQALTPTKAQPTYGYMNWFLNTDHKLLPSAPATSFVHIGNGTNLIYVDPEHDLVAVVRWIENKQMDEMIKKILEAVQ
ncbi:serine hydrolase [uncultured Chitinophaga sp.]|jgi:Beta-lactamase class C and other penicillin binding proteins|uniref:serine hydrolase domain-containing protein n=1 Tax=uncultured Chitinophaga sp. TaxID=339340 RepID=UPI002601EFD0|nr:serine hydrolase [uncultured Chitinophaga sp.]